MGKRSILRAPSGGSVSYEEWRDEAACKGMDTELFELDEDLQREESQQELIAWGLQICSGCPVRAACKADSDQLDRYWTTRGGQPPEGLFEDAVLPVVSFRKRKPASKSSGTCSKGHNEWVPNGAGRRRCLACERERAGKREPVVRGTKCKQGHDDWFIRTDGKRRCAVCQKLASAADWQRRKLKAGGKAG
jgi:hypothetical protein